MSTILRAYKTELDLNNHQRSLCMRHAGTARFAYNWGLARKIEARKSTGITLSCFDLQRELNQLKITRFPWMYEVSKCAPQEALRDLDKAYVNFFRRVKQKKSGSKIAVGFPKFKSRKKSKLSFRLTGQIHIFEKAIQLPRLGKLRLKEYGYLPTAGVHILSATVSERAGRWFVSIQVEQEIPDPQNSVGKPRVGVDLGIKSLAVVSDGTAYENPRALNQQMKKLIRLQRSVSRKIKGSANRKQAAEQLARCYVRISNIRNNSLHQITTQLAKTKSVVVLEDLNVSGMMKNRRLARAIADVGFSEFRRQMAYKGQWYGCEVVIADRFYPSTKRCSNCGNTKQEMDLAQRVYECEACGTTIDRDLNAAMNLAQLALT
jgi:transposase, IS605 OrfB family, central region